MPPEAIELQRRAVEELIQYTEDKDNRKDELTFKAPTGSGKTYMMADYMNQVLSMNDDAIFLVSTLSKGNLAKQNYDKFLQYSNEGKFSHINPYLINTNVSGEERLFIPTDNNVFLLPRDLYKAGGRLMQGCMENFLNTITMNSFFGGLGKKIVLIKDECHIATNNLDSLSESYFSRIINFQLFSFKLFIKKIYLILSLNSFNPLASPLKSCEMKIRLSTSDWANSSNVPSSVFLYF